MAGKMTAGTADARRIDGPRWRRLAFATAMGVGLVALLAACSDEAKDKIGDAIDEGARFRRC